MPRLLTSIIILILAVASQAQSHSNIVSAEFLSQGSIVKDRFWRQIELNIRLSERVPYRIYFKNDPKRFIVEFSTASFQNLKSNEFLKSKHVSDLSVSMHGSNWSRLSFELLEPFALRSAEMTWKDVWEEAELSIWLEPITNAEFAKLAKSEVRTNEKDVLRETMVVTNKQHQRSSRIVLDPGHGGVDPGAVVSGHKESDLMLKLALEVKEAFLLNKSIEVFLTRQEDDFLSLEQRVLFAKEKQADLLISLHADSLTKGVAFGTTVYTLSEMASDKLSESLALEHDRKSLLLGTDLTGADENVKNVLLDLASIDNTARTLAVANVTIEELLLELGSVNANPLRYGDFSILKSPDIPSILIEVGFMSTSTDLDNLTNPMWRTKFAKGLYNAVYRWISEDRTASIYRLK